MTIINQWCALFFDAFFLAERVLNDGAPTICGCAGLLRESEERASRADRDAVRGARRAAGAGAAAGRGSEGEEAGGGDSALMTGVLVAMALRLRELGATVASGDERRRQREQQQGAAPLGAKLLQFWGND